MIYILHGEDVVSSHNRLGLILTKHKNLEKIRLDEKSSKEEYIMANYSQNIVEAPKIIVCENFISAKKILGKEINANIDTPNILVLLEKQKISPLKLRDLNPEIIVEEFKLPPTLFYFLDSISANSFKVALKNLENLKDKSQTSILWQLTNRVYLISLAKLGMSKDFVSKITGKPLQDWQWSKVLNQSQKFEKDKLLEFLNSLLKIDYFLKSNRTNLEEKSLISILLFKYLL